MEQWASEAQEGEFAFHAANQWRRSSQFLIDNARLWEHFGFDANQLAGRVLVDIGAGSRLRTRYFVGARIFAIEPLASRFVTLDFSDLSSAEAYYSVPAETLVPELVGKADSVVSINALDHGFNFDAAVEACVAYLRPGGFAFLSFDLHDVADSLHPLLLTEASCRDSFARCGFTIQRVTRGLGPIGERYGHGQAINFWLLRPRESDVQT